MFYWLVFTESNAFLSTGPEVAGIAGTILAAPNTDVCLVILSGCTVIGNIAAMEVIIVAEHT